MYIIQYTLYVGIVVFVNYGQLLVLDVLMKNRLAQKSELSNRKHCSYQNNLNLELKMCCINTLNTGTWVPLIYTICTIT